MKLKRYTAETSDSTLDILVLPETDLDGIFNARCLLTGEILNVNGSMLSFDFVSFVGEKKVEIVNRETGEQRIYSDFTSIENEGERSLAKFAVLSGQHCCQGVIHVTPIHEQFTTPPRARRQAQELGDATAVFLSQFYGQDDELALMLGDFVGEVQACLEVQSSFDGRFPNDSEQLAKTVSGFIAHLRQVYQSR